MRKLLWGAIAIAGLVLTVLATIGIPMPSIARSFECAGNQIAVKAQPTLRIQDFGLAVAALVRSTDVKAIENCATAKFREKVEGSKLRDHAVWNIDVAGPDSVTAKAFVRWYQNRNLHDGKTIDASGSIEPHDEGALIKYSANIKSVPPWLEGLLTEESAGSMIVKKSDYLDDADWLNLKSVRLVQGKRYEGEVVVGISVWRYLFG